MRRHYLTPTGVHRCLGLVCLGAGIQEGILRPTPTRTLDCHAMVLITRGTGDLWWDREPRPHAIVAPTAFFLRPGVPHAYTPTGSGWHERWVLFDGTATRAYTDLGYLPGQEPVWQLAEPTTVRRAFDALLARCTPDNNNAEVETAALLHRLIVILQRCRRQECVDDTVVRAFRAAACQQLTISEHARELGVTVAELRALVRRVAGCTPKELLLRVRLNEAKTLLAESAMPVTEVSHRVGFADPAYFSRIFARRTGIAPRDFRVQEGRGETSGGTS